MVDSAHGDKLTVDKPPIPGVKSQSKGIRWTKAQVVIEVEYRGWTRADQKLRQPAFKGVREDKKLKDLTPLRIDDYESSG